MGPGRPKSTAIRTSSPRGRARARRWSPPSLDRRRRDFRHLIGLLEAPLTAQHEWLRPELPVYHLVSRAAPEHRILSDAEWAALATEMMHNIGLSRREEPEAGVRWIAVRHADDHIHIAATLARQDGRIARRDNDYYRVRDTCRIFEQRYRLRRTAPADNTATRRLPSGPGGRSTM